MTDIMESQEQMAASPRAEWGAFPDVIRNGDLGSLKAEPDYPAAKAGDPIAAISLVKRVVTDEFVESVRTLICEEKPVLVPVMAEEAAGRNKIPLALAALLGNKLGLDVSTDIIQTSRSHRTGKGADYRLTHSPSFGGPVTAEKPYFILDDTLSMGGTVAALRGYICQQGGKVLGAAVCTAHPGAVKLPATDKMLASIERKHGPEMNRFWKEEFGYDISRLTQGEAGHLKAAASVDRMRSRIAEARHEKQPGPDAKVPGKQESDGSLKAIMSDLEAKAEQVAEQNQSSIAPPAPSPFKR